MKISPINSININFAKRVNSNPSLSAPVAPANKQINQLSNVYYSPISFAGRVYSSGKSDLFEIPSNFQFVKFDDIPCPACGKKMLPRAKFVEFQERLEKTDPDKYLYLVGEYEEYMRPIEHSVYKEIKNLSSSQETTDIRKLVVVLKNTKLPQLQSIQRRKLKQMKKIARGLPANERGPLSIKLSELGRQIRKKSEEAPFRRKKMIQEIKEVKISNPYKYEKLQNLARAFPTSTDTNSAWIVKYSGRNKQNQEWTSKEIAERMLYYSVPNTDHIIPYGTERGHDDISNYLAMHSACNCTKTNKPFLQWYGEAPSQRHRNLTDYFEKVQEIIDSGQIKDSKYKDYVAYATDTIEHVSKGQIQLNNPDYDPHESIRLIDTDVDDDDDDLDLDDDVDDINDIDSTQEQSKLEAITAEKEQN